MAQKNTITSKEILLTGDGASSLDSAKLRNQSILLLELFIIDHQIHYWAKIGKAASSVHSPLHPSLLPVIPLLFLHFFSSLLLFRDSLQSANVCSYRCNFTIQSHKSFLLLRNLWCVAFGAIGYTSIFDTICSGYRW